MNQITPKDDVKAVKTTKRGRPLKEGPKPVSLQTRCPSSFVDAYNFVHALNKYKSRIEHNTHILREFMRNKPWAEPTKMSFRVPESLISIKGGVKRQRGWHQFTMYVEPSLKDEVIQCSLNCLGPNRVATFIYTALYWWLAVINISKLSKPKK